jgi:hypothetical protein
MLCKPLPQLGINYLHVADPTEVGHHPNNEAYITAKQVFAKVIYRASDQSAKPRAIVDISIFMQFIPLYTIIFVHVVTA